MQGLLVMVVWGTLSKQERIAELEEARCLFS